MSISTIGLRLAELERKVDRLAKKVNGTSGDPNAWIDEIHGTFTNDAAYRKAARLGAAWRKSHRKVTGARNRKAASR